MAADLKLYDYRVILITTTENDLAYIIVSRYYVYAEKMHLSLYAVPNLIERLQVKSVSFIRFELLEVLEDCTFYHKRQRTIHGLKHYSDKYTLLNGPKILKYVY